jgi:hypothetical protein
MFTKTLRNTALVLALTLPILVNAQDDVVQKEDELNEQYKARLASLTEREAGLRQRYMSMTISCIQQICDLSAAQQKKLELAAKGAVDKSLTKFQQQMGGTLIQQQKIMAQRRAGVRAAFPQNRPVVKYGAESAVTEKVWTTTLAQTLDADQLKAWKVELAKKAAFERKVMIDLSLAMISTQVHLVSKQREAITPLIEKQLADNGVTQGNTNVYTKVSREVLPKLAQLPEEQIAKVLSEAQLKAWKEYVGRFGARNGVGAQAIRAIRAVPAQRLVPAQRVLPAK